MQGTMKVCRGITAHPAFKEQCRSISIWMWVARWGGTVDCTFEDLRKLYPGRTPRKKIAEYIKSLTRHGAIFVEGQGAVRTLTVADELFAGPYAHTVTECARTRYLVSTGDGEWAGSRSAISAKVTRAVYARDGLACTYCGDDEGPFHLDHIVPFSKGGNDDIDNLCVACRDCNISKSNKSLKDWRASK